MLVTPILKIPGSVVSTISMSSPATKPLILKGAIASAIAVLTFETSTFPLRISICSAFSPTAV